MDSKEYDSMVLRAVDKGIEYAQMPSVVSTQRQRSTNILDHFANCSNKQGVNVFSRLVDCR